MRVVAGTRPASAPALALAAALVLGSAAAAQDGPAWTLSGQASQAAQLSWAEGADALSSSMDTGLALGLDARGGAVRASFRLRADLLVGDAAPAAIQLASLGATGALVAPGPGTPPGYALAADLERAWLRWNPGAFSLTAGRQVVNWGRALLWSPADLFAETSLAGMSPARAGIDAARLAVPLGIMGSAEAVAVPARDPAEASYGARLSGTVAGADMGLAARWDPGTGAFSVAADLKADLVLGLWAELAYSRRPGEPSPDGLALTAGADWSFLGGKLALAAEYHFDSSGAAPGETPAPGSAWPGRHYAFTMASLRTGDFTSLSLNAVLDIESALAGGMVALAVDVAQGSSLELAARIAGGSFATRQEALAAGAGATLTLSF